MADPNAPMPQQGGGNWTDLIVPFAVGAGSLGAGFAAGRNPGVDNAGAAFLQPLQTMSMLDYRRGLTQHQTDIADYYQKLYQHQQNQDVQARTKTAIDATKTAVELGNVDAILAAKDQLGTAFPSVFETAKARNAMLSRRGFVQPWQGGQQAPPVSPVDGLPAVSQGGPAAGPPAQVPSASPEGDLPYRQEQSTSFSAGGLTETRKTPASTNDELVSGFLNRYKSGVPSPEWLRADLARVNQFLQERGRPTIAWTKDAQALYETRLAQEQPTLFARLKAMEKQADVPAEVAARIATQGQGTPSPTQQAFTDQAAVQRERDALKAGRVEEEQRKGSLRFSPPPEANLKKIDEQDEVTRTAAAVMDLAPRIIQRYGNVPGFAMERLETIQESLGKQDPELAAFIRLNGRLYTAARNRISGTAVGKNEEAALNTFIRSPRDNPQTVMQTVEPLFRAAVIQQGQTIQENKIYGLFKPETYAYTQILERRQAGQPMYPELYANPEVSGQGTVGGGPTKAPTLKYNPTTKRIGPPEG